MERMNTRQGVRRAATILSIAVVAVCLAGCPNGGGKKSDPKPVGIVKQNVADALLVAEPAMEAVEGLRLFHAGTAAAKTRDDLRAAWKAQPSLAVFKDDFLDVHVFKLCVRDGSWPKDLSDADFDAACVAGVRQGVAEFLKTKEGGN